MTSWTKNARYWGTSANLCDSDYKPDEGACSEGRLICLGCAHRKPKRRKVPSADLSTNAWTANERRPEWAARGHSELPTDRVPRDGDLQDQGALEESGRK